MTKRSCTSLLILAFGALTLAGSAHALGFLEFQQAFGRKGSGGGAFSSEINLAFDADGAVYVSDAKNRVIQKLAADGTPVFQYPAMGSDELPVVLVKPGDIASKKRKKNENKINKTNNIPCDLDNIALPIMELAN